MAKRKRELVFLPHGAVELRSTTDGKVYRADWASDSDEDAAEALGEDVFGEDDADDILDYLEEIDILLPDEEVDLIEEYLDGEEESETDDEEDSDDE